MNTPDDIPPDDTLEMTAEFDAHEAPTKLERPIAVMIDAEEVQADVRTLLEVVAVMWRNYAHNDQAYRESRALDESGIKLLALMAKYGVSRGR